MVNFGGQVFFFFKIKAGRFLIFHAKLHVLSWFFLFLSKKRQLFEIFVDRMVQKLALGATGAKRLHRRAAAVTGVYTEIVEREALLQA